MVALADIQRVVREELRSALHAGALPVWTTARRAAEALGVSRDTVRRMVRRGDLESREVAPGIRRVRLPGWVVGAEERG